MKKALVVMSFGTTHVDSQKSIFNIEQKLQDHLLEYDFFRAFTSRMVINRLKKNQNMVVSTPIEVMQELVEHGYEEVICQPLHVINGIEYNKLVEEILEFKSHFKSLKISTPLLTTESDFKLSCEAILENTPALQDGEALVLMGHGTTHFSNASYCQLENTFRFMQKENIYVGTVEGFPDLDYVLDRLQKKNIKTAYIMPFMIVAGDHAKNDLAGDEEDSWKSILNANGIETKEIIIGLGEFEKIGDIFLEHLKETM